MIAMLLAQVKIPLSGKSVSFNFIVIAAGARVTQLIFYNIPVDAS